jgi:hypothetical protein
VNSLKWTKKLKTSVLRLLGGLSPVLTRLLQMTQPSVVRKILSSYEDVPQFCLVASIFSVLVFVMQQTLFD